MTRRMFLFALALAVAFTMIPGFAIAESKPAAADLEPSLWTGILDKRR